MSKYTMRDLALEVLNSATEPLSSQDIWEIAQNEHYDEKLSYKGTTPPHLNLYNTLNSDIKNKADSPFTKVSKNPALFILKTKADNDTQNTQKQAEEKIEKIEEKAEKQVKDSEADKEYGEADLHPALAMFVNEDSHFNCRVKTIRQQTASRRKKTSGKPKVKDEWTYPDLIGVYLPFQDYTDITTRILEACNVSTIKVFSFEMKILLNGASLRNSYFQAVSNSSWANEGYLVAAEIDDDPDFEKELSLLTNSFGIGIIKLNIEHPKESKIVIPARFKEKLDSAMLDKLIDRSQEVKALFEAVDTSIKVKKSFVDAAAFDKIYDDDEYANLTKDGYKKISGRKK